MKWTNELIMEFLELYEREPCIWNPKHPRHNLRSAVHDSWNNISKNFGRKLTIAELKKKKDSLMATFRKVENKVKSSEKTGSVYEPNWFAYEFMAKFLRGSCQPYEAKNKETIQNKTIKNESDESGTSFIDDENECELIEAEEKRTTPNKTLKIPTAHFSSGTSKKRKAEKIKQMESLLNEAYNHSKNAPEKPKRNKCSLYCELLEQKLGELDEQLQEYAMLEIDKFVYRLKQRKYTSQSHNTRSIEPVCTIPKQPSVLSTSTSTTYAYTIPSPRSQKSNSSSEDINILATSNLQSE